MNMELLEELNIELPYELGEFIESGHDCLSDYCHETADSDADVIYYAKAEALYSSASTEERDAAESDIEACGGFGADCNSMAQRFTILAYWITYNRLQATVKEQAEEAEKALRDKIDELEAIADTLGEL